MKKGFTIVELLMVLGILSVLITITVSAVTGSIQRARGRKTSAICLIVEQGIATYYAQTGEWPISTLADEEPNAGINSQGAYSTSVNNADKTVYLLDGGKVKDDGEVQKMVKTVIQEMKSKLSPMMDVSGLYVARKGSKYGMDFMDAVRGTKRNQEGIRLDDMIFGCPDSETGRFAHFKMAYSPATDSLKVLLPDGTENDLSSEVKEEDK